MSTRILNPLAAMAIILFCKGCLPVKAVAEATYTSEQLACVEESSSREQSHACRASVNKKWGVCLPSGDCKKEGK